MAKSDPEALKKERQAFRRRAAAQMGNLLERYDVIKDLPSWFAISIDSGFVELKTPISAFLKHGCKYQPDVWAGAVLGVVKCEPRIDIELVAETRREISAFRQSKVGRRLSARLAAITEVGLNLNVQLSQSGRDPEVLETPNLDTAPEGVTVYTRAELARRGINLRSAEARRERDLVQDIGLLGPEYKGAKVHSNQFPIKFKGEFSGERADRVDILAEWKDRLLIVELKARGDSGTGGRSLDVLSQGLDYALFFRRARKLFENEHPLNLTKRRLVIAGDEVHPLLPYAINGLRADQAIELDVRVRIPYYLPYDEVTRFG